MHDKQLVQPHRRQSQSLSASPGSPSPPGPATDRDNGPKARFPVACKECRRRKQKCSHTHPCTNCARRFPQPICEYGGDAPKKSSWGSPPGNRPKFASAGAGGLYSHLDMDSVHDALLDVEGKLDFGVAVDNLAGIQTHTLPPTYKLSHREMPVFLMEDESWSGDKLFRMKFRDKSGLLKDRNLIEMVQYILQTRLRVANTIVKDEWEIDGKQLIRAITDRRQPSQNISSFEDEVQRLPMAPSKMNKELVRTHLQLMSRFKASLDGSPRPKNRFMKHWIPYSIQDRLVLHVVLCTTASFLHETGRLPKMLLYIHRATATHLLNEYISSPTLCTSDSAMLAVVQLILTSWYWSSTEELHAHMIGFKRMIKLRGSCHNLGMEGFTSKIALLNDAVIALSHETEPLLFNQLGCEFEDALRVPLQVTFNSPLLFDGPPFLIPSSTLRLHQYTAEILDRSRLLLQAVVEAPAEAAESILLEVHQRARDLVVFLDQLPEQVLLPSDGGRDMTAPGQKRKRHADDEASKGDAAPATEAEDTGGPCLQPADDPPDMVYQCVRLTAQLYARAIMDRVPTSRVCSEAEFVRLWSFAWAAGLDRWSSLSGIYAWMMIALGPTCHETIHARMVKTLTVTTFTYVGTENWHVAESIADAALRLQAWLRRGAEGKPSGMVSGAYGGEKAIDDHGFAFKENMPDLPDHRNREE